MMDFKENAKELSGVIGKVVDDLSNNKRKHLLLIDVYLIFAFLCTLVQVLN